MLSKMSSPPSRGRGRRIGATSSPSTATTIASLGQLSLHADMAPKPPSTAVNHPDYKTVDVETNMFRIHFNENIPIYRYELEMWLICAENNKRIDFTRGAGNDALCLERKNKCYQMFCLFCNHYKEFIPNPKGLYYDRARTLYSVVKLNLETNKMVLTLPGSIETRRFEMIIQACADNFQLRLGAPNIVTNGDDLILKQFLEIATSQQLFLTSDEHRTWSSRTFPRSSVRPLASRNVKDGDNYELALGFVKSVTTIGHPNGGEQMVLQIKPLHAVFYAEQSVIDFVRTQLSMSLEQILNECASPNGMRRGCLMGLSNQMKDMRMYDNVQQRYYNADSVVHRPTSRDDLKYSKLPFLVERKGGNQQAIFHPMEHCKVVADQQVPNEKMSPALQEAVVQIATVPPSVQKTNIAAVVQRSGIFANGFLNEVGITINTRPETDQAVILPPPNIVYKNKVVPVDAQRAQWNMNNERYTTAGECGQWALLLLCGYPLNEHQCGAFIRELQKRYKTANGRDLVSPAYIRDGRSVPHGRRDHWILQQLSDLTKHQCDFIMFFSETKNNSSAHHFIKSCESHFGIVSQDILRKNVLKIVNDGNIRRFPTILSNFTHKFNQKCGGVNYEVRSSVANRIKESNVLVIGMDVNHPGKGSDHPSIVGLSYNVAADPLVFSGEFAAQNHHQEEVDGELLEGMIQGVLKTYHQNRGQFPKWILFYRDGVSMGQLPMVRAQEEQAVRRALRRVQAPTDCQLTIVVAVKDSTTQLFPQHLRPNDPVYKQNVPPGTLVERALTHPILFEFLLCSHSSPLGTANVPKMIVVVDDRKGDAAKLGDDLKLISYHLTYNSQIVTKATRLLQPIRDADELAKRGRNNFNQLLRNQWRGRLPDMDDINKELRWANNDFMMARKMTA